MAPTTQATQESVAVRLVLVRVANEIMLQFSGVPLSVNRKSTSLLAQTHRVET